MQKKRQKYDEAYHQTIQRVNCTLKRTEYGLLKKAAGKSGLTATAFLKKIAVAQLEKQVILPVSLEQEARRLSFLLANIANNLNQIARKANRIKRATVFDLLQAKQNVYVLEKAMEKFLLTPKYDGDYQELKQEEF